MMTSSHKSEDRVPLMVLREDIIASIHCAIDRQRVIAWWPSRGSARICIARQFELILLAQSATYPTKPVYLSAEAYGRGIVLPRLCSGGDLGNPTDRGQDHQER